MLKALIGFLALIGCAWLLIPNKLPYKEFPVLGVSTVNEMVLSQFNAEYANKEIVLVGSSVLTFIPPYQCRPENVATLYLQGLGAMTGLEAISIVGAMPKIIFIETTTIDRGISKSLLDSVYRPLYWRIQSAIPILAIHNNWVLLLTQYLTWYHTNPIFRGVKNLELPAITLEEYNSDVLEKRIAPYLKDTLNKDQRDNYSQIIKSEIIPKLKEQIIYFKSKGIRVIFFDPSDSRIKSLSTIKILNEEIKKAMPDVEYLDSLDGSVQVYRHDGLHLLPPSGVEYFNAMMKSAGLDVRSECIVLKRNPKEPS